MMQTKRTPISCGCTQLHDLIWVSKKALENMLQPEYKVWGVRERPKERPGMVDQEREYVQRQRHQGVYDNKIYAGETVVFSDNDSYGNAKKLVQYIKRFKLGEVVSLSGRNPNSLNDITTYLWRYNGAKVPTMVAKKKKVTTK